MARTGFFAQGKIRGKLPPKAHEEGSNWGSKRGHCMFISENLPRCDIINSSWLLTDLLKDKEVCIVVHSPDLSRLQRWSNLPFS